jgi:hypothetical protein
MQRSLLAVLFFLMLSNISSAQQSFIDSIITHHSIHLPVYKISTLSNDTMWLKMPYAKSDFIDTTGISVLQHSQILSIDLLYTDYPANDDLVQLNKSRLAAIKNLLPYSVQEKNIQWQVVRQMDGKDKLAAQNMIHGFVINYRKPVTKEFTEKELDRVHNFIDKKKEELEAKKPKEKINHWAVMHNIRPSVNTVIFGRFIKKVGDHPDSLAKDKRTGDSIVPFTIKQAIEKRIILPINKKDKKDSDSLFVLLQKKLEALPPGSENNDRTIQDSTVIKILERVPMQNSLVVADVTASMSPWLIQLLQFLSANEVKNKFAWISCFNDGDDKNDIDKKLGTTGGIYGEPYLTALHAADLVSLTMQKGRGGDIAENVCEAIIRASEQTKNFSNIVLLADSWAPVRDISLVNNIKKPVNIVLCGNRTGVHPDYLTIALFTGGTVVANNQPPFDMTALRSGEVVKYNFKSYQLVNGVIHELQ